MADNGLAGTDRIIAAERLYLDARREGKTRDEGERALAEAGLHLSDAKLDRMERERTWERA